MMRVRDVASWLKYRLKRVIGLKPPFVPEEIRQDDVFIVSYPKSGNTWVRFLLANALYPKVDVDFHTIHELIPEVGKEGMRRSGMPAPRILKSHAPYCPAYPRVIYILRDGRDVYTSYYHYSQPNLSADTTFEEFIGKDQWPTRWAEHVGAWLDAAGARDDILVVRFEDLKEDTARELRRMVDFLGREESMSESQIRLSVKNSSFEKMRRLEQDRGRKYGKVDQFMREGKPGGWKNIFTDKARKIFQRREGRVLVRAGYAEGREW